MWLLMASMLATLNITKPVDKEGNVIEPKVEYLDSIFRCASYNENDFAFFSHFYHFS
jgi:hypothetical protein